MKAVLFHIFDHEKFRRWPEDFPEMDWSMVFSPSDLERAIADAEILLLTNRAASPEVGSILRDKARALKWMHFLTAGFDRGIAMGLPDGVAVSHSPGIRADNISEHAMALLLALFRGFPQIAKAQRERKWLREEIGAGIASLAGATICIAGLGHVGRAIARKLKPFNATIIAVSRAGRPDENIFDVYPREKLHDALSRSDAVLIATEADESSVRLIGREAFAAMKPGAVLVNVARGAIVDESALVEALRSGRLGGAALDVQEVEPLPEDSPLWELPNVIVSPHSAGAGRSAYESHRALFRDNLERFQNGIPLRHQYK